MKVVHIIEEKSVKRSKKELEKMPIEDGINNINPFAIRPSRLYKTVRLKEPIYVVEMTNKEYQLVSFYLELERREPITKIKLDTELGGEKK